MEIKNFLACKRDLENRIARLIQDEMFKFEDQTGVYPTDISVQMVEIIRLDGKGRKYAVSRVNVRTELD